MEVEEGLEGEDGCDVVMLYGFLHLRVGLVVAIYIGLVVGFVVEFHYFAGDVGFKSTVVI